MMQRMTVLMEVTRLFVHQSMIYFGPIFETKHFTSLGVKVTTGFAAIMAIASPISGCVTRRTTAWTGVMRLTVRRRKPLLLNLILQHVLALTTGDYYTRCVESSLLLYLIRCGDGLCIPVSWTCDQQDDCRTGDDENPKLCGKEEECNEFTCSTGACIPHRLVSTLSVLKLPCRHH